MIDLAAVRAALAQAASTPDIPCLPYTPDNPYPPIAFIDSLVLDHEDPAAYTLPARGTAVIVAVGQRNDRQAATGLLESQIGKVTAQLEDVPSLRIAAIVSGTVEIGKTELPAVSYTVQFVPAQ